MHTISGYILKHAWCDWCLPHAVNVQDTIGIYYNYALGADKSTQCMSIVGQCCIEENCIIELYYLDDPQ